MHELDQLTKEDITRKLIVTGKSGHDIPSDFLSGNYRQAGVLIPFLRIEQQWHILYIRRAELAGDRHSGQVAFPGGKHEEQDNDLFATALREAHEEVGIQPQDVDVLGELGNHHSVSNFRITPVIGTIPWPYPLLLQTSEVGRAFTIPLHWLADPANHELRPWNAPGIKRPVDVAYFNEYDGELLWGATARMTLSLLELLRG
ncbi:MAG: NUDIX hydrolase [Thiolinea sp.]